MEATSAPAPRQRKIPAAILVLVVLVILYPLTLFFYQQETANRSGGFTTDATTQPNRLDLRGQIIAVDLVRGDLNVRFSGRPTGDLLNQDGLTLSRDVRMLVDTDSGTTERTFPKGRPLAPFEVTVSIFGGEASDYPFDSHEAILSLYATSGEGAAAATVPLALDFNAAWQGLLVDAVTSSDAAPGQIKANLAIGRSATTIAVAVFIMIVQVGLAIALVFLLVSLLQKRRKIELGMFAWMGAMLFAFPALRNISPGIPPVVGTLSDYMAFFWAECLVALVLLVTVTTWLVRPAS